MKSNLKWYLLLLFVIAFVNFPLIFMFIMAFSKTGFALKLDFSINRWTFENFKIVWNQFKFSRYFVNSLLVAFTASLLSTLFAALSAYVFAKKEFKLKYILMAVILASFAIPGILYLIPQFLMIIKMHLYDTFLALVLPHLANTFGFMLFYGFISKLPNSLIEAAVIDGASECQIFRNVIMPLIWPIFITIFVLNFLFHWSNFIWQLVVLKPSSIWTTLPVGIASFRGQYGNYWELMMAASVFSVLPLLIMFIISQRVFIEGMTQGAIKGDA